MLKKISKIHNEAMLLVDKADLAKLKNENHLEFLREAYRKEKQAAYMLKDSEMEPSRSILLRSAASLGYEIGEYNESEKLVCLALSGNPPKNIAEELKNLYEDINFHRHLKLNGITLTEEEFQMSLSGKSVGYGICDSEEFIQRIDTLTKMIQRTVQRKTNKSKKLGRLPNEIKSKYSPFISLPRASSYAISFKLSSPDEQLEIFSDFTKKEVIDDVLGNIELYNNENFDELKKKIDDKSYYNNFVNLCDKLLPDGEKISLVGFTSIRQSKEQRLILNKAKKTLTPKKNNELSTNILSKLNKGDEIVIQGILLVADKKAIKPEIQVKSNNVFYRVRIPEGIMDDIVRPLWDKEVIISGTKHSKTIILLDKIQELRP